MRYLDLWKGRMRKESSQERSLLLFILVPIWSAGSCPARLKLISRPLRRSATKASFSNRSDDKIGTKRGLDRVARITSILCRSWQQGERGFFASVSLYSRKGKAQSRDNLQGRGEEGSSWSAVAVSHVLDHGGAPLRSTS